MRASYRSVVSNLRAAAGSSHAPGTHTRSTLSGAAPCRLSASIAPSTSLSVIGSLNRLAMTANRRPDAAGVPLYSAIVGLRCHPDSRLRRTICCLELRFPTRMVAETNGASLMRVLNGDNNDLLVCDWSDQRLG